MWLIYYRVKGNKGWYHTSSKEQAEKWMEENLDIGCEDFCDIVDLKRTDIVEELKKVNNKLKMIEKIIKE